MAHSTNTLWTRAFFACAFFVICAVAGVGVASAQIVTGSYVGNGSESRSITGFGARPDVVIIKGETKQAGVMRTSTMIGDNAKSLDREEPVRNNLIRSFDADGITVGDDHRVNKNGVSYFYVAFKTLPGQLYVGMYIGSGRDTSIAGVGFAPDLVMVVPEKKEKLVYRTSTMDSCNFLNENPDRPRRIRSLDSDGFSITGSGSINKRGDVYHFIAWRTFSGMMNTGAYVGNEVDNRQIGGIGFEPRYILVGSDHKERVVHRSDAVTGNNTLEFNKHESFSNGIKGLTGDGFILGRDKKVNKNNKLYHWIAFGGSGPLPIQLASFSGVVVNGQHIRLDWRTVSELNNFGFFVERRTVHEDQFGEIPGAFVPGNGTTVIPYDYSYLDQTVPGPGSYEYRLRQVDLDGTVHYTDPIIVDFALVMSVGDETTTEKFGLVQNYPNPFNPTTRIAFSLAKPSHVQLAVYDIVGRKVAELADGQFETGVHSVEWNATNGAGQPVAGGIYYARLTQGGTSTFIKMMLMK